MPAPALSAPATRTHLTAMKASRPTTTARGSDHDPRHTFLTAREVIARYRWGRTKGYQQLRDQNFPRPVAGRYRLDLLMAWEDKQINEAADTVAHRPEGPPAKRHFDRKASA